MRTRLHPCRLAAALLPLVLAGCITEYIAHRREPQSFKATIVCAGATKADCPPVADGAAVCPAVSAPADLGTPGNPVDRSQRFYMVQVDAIGTEGDAWPFEGSVRVSMMFEGTVSPPRGAALPALKTAKVTAGRACVAVSIPPAFNETALWIEDADQGDDGSFAVGASQRIYRPAPKISDVTQTGDVDGTVSPLANKHVVIETGTGGQPMVVTGIFAQWFAVTDLGTEGKDHPWGSIDVYSYSQPQGLVVGSKVKNLNGTVQMFNGLPELSFPIWEVDGGSDASLVPAAHEIKLADIAKTLDKMAPYVMHPVEVKKWKICAPLGRDQSSWEKYQQWKVAPPESVTADGSCQDRAKSLSVVSNITVPSFKPMDNVGKTLCRVSGILSHVVPARGIHLWMINPRDGADLDASAVNVVNAPGECPPN